MVAQAHFCKNGNTRLQHRLHHTVVLVRIRGPTAAVGEEAAGWDREVALRRGTEPGLREARGRLGGGGRKHRWAMRRRQGRVRAASAAAGA